MDQNTIMSPCSYIPVFIIELNTLVACFCLLRTQTLESSLRSKWPHINAHNCRYGGWCAGCIVNLYPGGQEGFREFVVKTPTFSNI